ncbi:hypothetical protein GJAV_G00054690 [Gymnothorax javanicus]|nr:hypothetical protein GJAV_G00054690 [Gymnothorax javanicus]
MCRGSPRPWLVTLMRLLSLGDAEEAVLWTWWWTYLSGYRQGHTPLGERDTVNTVDYPESLRASPHGDF